MRQSKYTKELRQLSKHPFFSSKEARDKGIPPRMLDYFAKKGKVERIGRGLYSVPSLSYDDFQWEDLVKTTISISGGIICLISALCYYDLTDEIMREFWIAVPHSTTAPKRKLCHITRMRNMTLGVTQVNICGCTVSIFNQERTIIDSFRFLDQETALKALKIYLGKNKPDIKKLTQYARELRVNIDPYLITLLI